LRSEISSISAGKPKIISKIIPKNVFNANPPGPSTAVSDGYWVMFEPPSVGDHDIKFAGCSGNPSGVVS
jgi:hypothetical protein